MALNIGVYEVGIISTSLLLILALTPLCKKNPKNKQYNKVLEANGVYKSFPLVAKTALTKDTAIYRFGLPKEDDVLGLPIGQHISVKTTVPDKESQEGFKNVVRAYTPISLDEDCPGYFDLLIKSYELGTVSRMFGKLSIGDKIDITGPQGFYDYRRNCRDAIGMVAGGTGITPMYQVMKAIFDDVKDKTQVHLIYGSRCEEELFLKKEIDLMVSKRPNQFYVYYLVEQTDRDDWEGGIGYVTREIMETHLPSPGPKDKVQLLICGPPKMVSFTKRTAMSMGFQKGGPVSKMHDQIFMF